MPIKTKSVPGRRELSFSTLDDIISDAERLLSSTRMRTLGNWPLTQLLTHLAMTVNNSIDGFQVKAPLIIRLIGPLLKGRMTTRKMSPGLNLPKNAEAAAFPDAASAAAAFEDLRRAVARTKSERMQAAHPAFGRMNHDEWTQLHLRHSDMHLSFAVFE